MPTADAFDHEERVFGILNGLNRLYTGGGMEIRENGGIGPVQPSGRRQIYSNRMSVRTPAEVELPDTLAPQADLAAEDADVGEVLRWYAAGEYEWVNLQKVFALIMRDVKQKGLDRLGFDHMAPKPVQGWGEQRAPRAPQERRRRDGS